MEGLPPSSMWAVNIPPFKGGEQAILFILLPFLWACRSLSGYISRADTFFLLWDTQGMGLPWPLVDRSHRFHSHPTAHRTALPNDNPGGSRLAGFTAPTAPPHPQTCPH